MRKNNCLINATFIGHRRQKLSHGWKVCGYLYLVSNSGLLRVTTQTSEIKLIHVSKTKKQNRVTLRGGGSSEGVQRASPFRCAFFLFSATPPHFKILINVVQPSSNALPYNWYYNPVLQHKIPIQEDETLFDGGTPTSRNRRLQQVGLRRHSSRRRPGHTLERPAHYHWIVLW